MQKRKLLKIIMLFKVTEFNYFNEQPRQKWQAAKADAMVLARRGGRLAMSPATRRQTGICIDGYNG